MDYEPIKILKWNKKNLLISIGVILLGIVFIFVGAAFSIYPDDLTPVSYDELISTKSDEPEMYATVTIKYLPYLFAEETGEYSNNNYYIIFDEDNYPYIARLTDETYQLLEKKYDNGEDISFELNGFLYSQESKLKELALDAHKELFEDSEITIDNYEMYFGKTYLDENRVPSTLPEIIFVALGFVFSFIGFICFIVSIVSKIRFKKNLYQFNLDDLKYEVGKASAIYYKKQEVCLTDSYVISTFMGIDIIRYEDILWLYTENRRYNFISIGKYLIACTNKKKAIQLSYVYKNEVILNEIMQKIYEKNHKIMLGYNKENHSKYKELTKKKDM